MICSQFYRERKHFFKLLTILTFISLLITIPFSVTAQANTIETSETVRFEGGYIITEKVVYAKTRGYGTSGSKSVKVTNNSGEVQCRLFIHATFTVNTGVSVKCTEYYPRNEIYNSAWAIDGMSAKSNSVGSATASATFLKKFLGITINKVPVSVTLNCDTYGNLY